MPLFDAEGYWNSLVSGSMSLDKVGYAEFGANWNAWTYKIRATSFHRALAGIEINPDMSRVLEVGFGIGFYLEYWRRRGLRNLVGVDISKAAVDAARKKYPEYKFYHGDISTVELNEPGFDIVTVVDVFYHIVDDAGFRAGLEKLYSLLKPRGVILFTDRLEEDLLSDPRFPHVRCRSLSSYRAVVEKLGGTVTPLHAVLVVMANPSRTSKFSFPAVVLRQTWRAISIPLLLTSKFPKLQGLLGNVLGLSCYVVDSLLVAVWKSAPNLRFGIIRRGG